MSSGLLGNPFASMGIDFYGFFLPWIFTFAIVFGLLSKANVFGQNNNQRISAALAFVIAFFVTAVGGPQLAGFFTSIFGGASMFLAGILVIILFTTMIGHEGPIGKHMWALAAVVLIGIMLFLASSGQFVTVSVITPDLAGMLFWIVIIIVAVYFVMGTKPEGGGGKPQQT